MSLLEIAFAFVVCHGNLELRSRSVAKREHHDVTSSLPRISRCLLPVTFNSKWLLAGTYNGNVYVINLDTFALSSYKIMWNNAIGMYVFATRAMPFEIVVVRSLGVKVRIQVPWSISVRIPAIQRE